MSNIFTRFIKWLTDDTDGNECQCCQGCQCHDDNEAIIRRHNPNYFNRLHLADVEFFYNKGQYLTKDKVIEITNKAKQLERLNPPTESKRKQRFDRPYYSDLKCDLRRHTAEDLYQHCDGCGGELDPGNCQHCRRYFVSMYND